MRGFLRTCGLAACLVAGLVVGTSRVTAAESESERTLRAGDYAECASHHARVHAGGDSATRKAAMTDEIAAYQSLAEEALSMRAQAIALYHELREKQRRGEPFSGNDLLRLNSGAAAMLAQREKLLALSVAHECWIDAPRPADAGDAQGQASGIALTLSAALLLYDNYLSAIALYRADNGLRQHLNRTDKAFDLQEGRLNRIALSFASPLNRLRVRRALRWFDENGYDLAGGDEGYRYLVQLIEQSPARNIVREVQPVQFVGRLAGFFSAISFDTLMELKDQGVFVPSMLFGNAVGLVESRRGKLDAQPELEARVSGALRAGDILLEKTPVRLTDSFIPGHWGHVAIWIGTPRELRELGIWEHPVVRRHHQEIEAGRCVVEALRSGVKMNPLQHFMNIDDLAVLREPTMPAAQRAQVIVQALRQVGKGYDFNFDAVSTDRIVCSELVYHVYNHHHWPTARHLGRVTISPDNVALRALPGDILDVVLLFHDGQAVDGDLPGFMARLLKKPVDDGREVVALSGG
jgi:uncharacterized protein YycO